MRVSLLVVWAIMVAIRTSGCLLLEKILECTKVGYGNHDSVHGFRLRISVTVSWGAATLVGSP